MQLKRLFTDDDAVSPVIGVILMVAITVILAAVIASFVLGLGGEQQATPQVTMEFDYEVTDSSVSPNLGLLTVTHNGGDDLEAGEVEFRGSGETATAGATEDSSTWASNEETWAVVSGGSAGDTVSTGDSVTLGATSAYDLTVVYVPSEGGDTAPLADDEGPDA